MHRVYEERNARFYYRSSTIAHTKKRPEGLCNNYHFSKKMLIRCDHLTKS